MLKQRFLKVLLSGMMVIMPAFAHGGTTYSADESGAVIINQTPKIDSNFFDHESKIKLGLSALAQFSVIQKAILDGVTSSIDKNVISLNNLRILSSTTTLNDYISISFLLDVGTMRLLPVSTYIAKNLGIYVKQFPLFSRNVPPDIYLTTPTQTKLSPNQEHSITATANDKFTMSLQAGTVFAYRVRYPSDDFILYITEPDGSQYEKSTIYKKGSNWVSFNYDILRPGIYTFRFAPQHNPALTLRFGFTNQNRTTLTDVASGSSISVALSSWGYQYAKYRIQLRAGDLLSLTDPSGPIKLYFIDSNSNPITWGDGPLNYKVNLAGVYYIFVGKTDPWSGANYNGTVTVTPDPNRLKYSILNNIPNQTIQRGVSYILQLAATNSPTEFNVTGLPLGLTVNKTTGRISGAPTLSGTFALSAFAKNSFGGDRKDFLLKVQ